MSQPDGSVHDAIYLAAAERQNVSFELVKQVLTHREIPGDDFWAAWDQTVSDAVSLYCRMTGTEIKEET